MSSQHLTSKFNCTCNQEKNNNSGNTFPTTRIQMYKATQSKQIKVIKSDTQSEMGWSLLSMAIWLVWLASYKIHTFILPLINFQKGVCMCVYIHGEVIRKLQLLFLSTYSLCSLRKSLSLTWNSASRLGWLHRLGFAYLCCPALGLWVHTIRFGFSNVYTEDWTLVLIVVRDTLNQRTHFPAYKDIMNEVFDFAQFDPDIKFPDWIPSKNWLHSSQYQTSQAVVKSNEQGGWKHLWRYKSASQLYGWNVIVTTTPGHLEHQEYNKVY